MGLVLLFESFQGMPLTSQKKDTISKKGNKTKENLRIRKKKQLPVLWPMGILLYHDGLILYQLKKKEDGTYDFHSENFEYVTPWLKQADLAIGDFEGTINKDHYLAGYPHLMPRSSDGCH